MININEIKSITLDFFSNFETKVDEFKPNELIYIYIDVFKEKNWVLCIEITNKYLGLTKLDKSLEFNFSLNDEVFENIEVYSSYIKKKFNQTHKISIKQEPGWFDKFMDNNE